MIDSRNPTGRQPVAGAAVSGLNRWFTPDTKITVGAWLLCMTGLLAFLTPSDLPASAFFRLSLAGAGFALYAWGRTDKHRRAILAAGGSQTQFLRTLSGWLIVLGLLLVVTLVGAVVQAVADIPQILAGKVWAEYTTPGRPAYHPCWPWLLALDWGSNLFVVAFVPVLLWLFLHKKRVFPTVMFWSLLLFVTLAALRFGVADRISILKGNAQALPMALAVLKAMVWIPYLRVSKRVKATFVN
jgi:hypothetical protein